MGAQKGLKRATLKFTQKQLPAVLEARKKNKHMKIKAKQAVQTKANLQVKGANSRITPAAACGGKAAAQHARRCVHAQPPGCGAARGTATRARGACRHAVRRALRLRAASPRGESCVAGTDTRRLPCLLRAAADAAAAAEAKKRRAADIGVDEFLDGAFKELGSASDDDSGDNDAAAASDGSDSDEARAHRALL